MKRLKEKILGWLGGISGSLSFLGGYQVCHSLCMWLISVLTILGFTVAGMPLIFLTRVAIPFWVAAFILLFLTIVLKYSKGMNISSNLILLNSGLLIAGIPFQELEQFNYIFWIIGGVLVIFSIGWFIYDKLKNKV